MTIENELRHVHAEGRMGRTPDFAAIAANITALSARASAGEGGEWVMVPRELPLDMWEAAVKARNLGGDMKEVYEAMLAAAPQPQPTINSSEIDSKLTDARPATPPAHGDGEGEPVSWRYRYFDKETGVGFWRYSHGEPQCSAYVGDLGFEKHPLFTRPTPEAQEARDGEGPWCPSCGSMNITVSQVVPEHTRQWTTAEGDFVEHMPQSYDCECGNCSHQWTDYPIDVEVDAALALPAQGENNDG